jgi:hypothetical protein
MSKLCSSFRREAGAVWNRMQTAAKLGISLSEETVTELTINNLAVEHKQKNFRVDLATKHAESKHGADWEWWFTKGNQGICFRVQAKRLYPNGTYNSLIYPKSKGIPYKQLDKLVQAASADGHEALYCFYNFPHAHITQTNTNPCHHDYRRPSFWGCTLAFPHEVKAKGSNSIVALQPIMFPWHVLVCGTSAARSLPDSANDFVGRRGRSRLPLRDIPDRVRNLILLGDARRADGLGTFIDDEINVVDSDPAAKATGLGGDLAGIAVFRDLRDYFCTCHRYLRAIATLERLPYLANSRCRNGISISSNPAYLSSSGCTH